MSFPTPIYPAGVVDANQLKVAVNFVSTTLASPMAATDTLFTVKSNLGIVVNELLTIDQEIVCVAAISGNNISVGVGGVVSIAGRGFDGTVAKAHLVNAAVSGDIDAWHHNAMAAEVQSIESTLGVNMANVRALVSPTLSSSYYNFSPLTPGGTLVGGNTVNTITLNPYPPGMAAGGSLYISGGTGTAEAATVTGTTSTTVTVICANAHSGAWTIQSATSGIQEAINALPTGGYGGGVVTIPQGTWNIYGTIVVKRQYGVSLIGAGMVATALHWLGPTSGDVIILDGTNSPGGIGQNHRIWDMQVEGTSVSGSTNYAIHCDSQSNVQLARITFAGLANGVRLTAPTGQWNLGTFRDLDINLPAVGGGDGVRIEAYSSGGTGGVFSNVQVGGDHTSATNGFHVTGTGGLVLEACGTLYCGNGLLIAPQSGQTANFIWCTDCVFDSGFAAGIALNPGSGGLVYGAHFVNGWTSSNATAGVLIGSGGTVDGVMFVAHRSLSNTHEGYVLNGGTNMSFVDCIAAGNSFGSAGSYNGMTIGGSISRVQVAGGTYAQSYGQLNTQSVGIYVQGGGGADYISIHDAVCVPNHTAGAAGSIVIASTIGSNCNIDANIGYNPVGQSTISVGSSPFTYTAGSSPTTVYIYGGTVSKVELGSGPTQVASSTGVSVSLSPNESVKVTYSGAPTMIADVQ